MSAIPSMTLEAQLQRAIDHWRKAPRPPFINPAAERAGFDAIAEVARQVEIVLRNRNTPVSGGAITGTLRQLEQNDVRPNAEALIYLVTSGRDTKRNPRETASAKGQSPGRRPTIPFYRYRRGNRSE